MVINYCTGCGTERKFRCPADEKRFNKTGLCYGCSRHLKGDQSGRWKGGISYHHGYRMLNVPSHPNAKSNGYVFEHRLVMEEQLGRYLEPQEIIHHKNHDKLDNRIENLLLTTQHEHAKHDDHIAKPKYTECCICGGKHLARGFCSHHYWTEFLKAHRAAI